MTKWCAWFQDDKNVEPYSRLLVARDIGIAETIASDLATRDRVELIGIIVAPE